MKAYLKLDFNFIVMIYYHYTHLKAAFKILNDQKIIVSRAEKKMGAKNPACWFSTNAEFEIGQFATYRESGETHTIKTVEEMALTMGSVRFGFNKLNGFISFAKYKHASKDPIELYNALQNEGHKIGADTKEWYACFMPVDLNYYIAAEVYLEGKWVEIAKNKDEQFLVSTLNKAMKVSRFFTD